MFQVTNVYNTFIYAYIWSRYWLQHFVLLHNKLMVNMDFLVERRIHGSIIYSKSSSSWSSKAAAVMILPPSCLAVGMTLSLWNAVLVLRQM